MKARRLFALSILAIAFGCEGHQSPTAPTIRSVPLNHAAILSDGAHGGNPDFFFLPPLVPSPYGSPNFDAGKADNRLQAGLTVEICELKPEVLKGKPENDGKDKLTVPNAGTACIPNEPRKKFGVGSVVLVTDPNTAGWWTPSEMPPDGFYYALWDTHKIDLKDRRFYRIKVFLDGVSGPLGYVDVQQIEDHKKWRNVETGDVIRIADDAVLPIPFRVESGALCGGATDCTSTEVTNSGATVKVNVDGEAVAGALFPPGWLPKGGPLSVIVTISHVNTGENDLVYGTQEIPCHAGLPFQQFDGCYKFTTTPTLAFIGHSSAQFATPVTVAVCYVLEGTGDRREKFAEMYASGPNEPPHALEDVSDVFMGAFARNCTPEEVGSTNPVMHLASTAWRKFRGGVGELLGVKTAYAVDVGLGGLIDAFSNVGAVLPATIQAYPTGGTTLTLVSGAATASVMIVGNDSHQGASDFTGVDNVAVTFTVTPDNGSFGEGEGSTYQVTTFTHAIEVPGVEGLVHGVASADWIPPTGPGTYRMTASGPTTNGPVTFRVTVPRAAAIGLDVLAGGGWVNTTDAAWNVYDVRFSIDGNVVTVFSSGICEDGEESSLCDWGAAAANTTRWANRQEISVVVARPSGTKTMTMKYIPGSGSSPAVLRVTTVTVFTDGRAGYTTTEDLRFST